MHSVAEKSTYPCLSKLFLWIVLFGVCLSTFKASALQAVSLAWDANSETNIAGYKLYYGTASRLYTNVVDVGNVTNFSLPNLAEGINYYFAITAYNSLGMESDFSAEVITSGAFRVQSFSAAPTGGGFTIAWASTPGAIYRVRARTTLAETNWNVRSSDITAVTTTTSWTDSNLGTARARFYLIERLAP